MSCVLTYSLAALVVLRSIEIHALLNERLQKSVEHLNIVNLTI
jgi:hypothetical protein